MGSSLQTAVRPLITIVLTLTFSFLIIIPFIIDIEIDKWGEVFISFMGVYGIILGFWFGERAALKVPGKEDKVE